jgi:hypothetical protein
VVGAEREKIVYVDSSRAPVVCVDSRRRLRQRDGKKRAIAAPSASLAL